MHCVVVAIVCDIHRPISWKSVRERLLPCSRAPLCVLEDGGGFCMHWTKAIIDPLSTMYKLAIVIFIHIRAVVYWPNRVCKLNCRLSCFFVYPFHFWVKMVSLSSHSATVSTCNAIFARESKELLWLACCSEKVCRLLNMHRFVREGTCSVCGCMFSFISPDFDVLLVSFGTRSSGLVFCCWLSVVSLK